MISVRFQGKPFNITVIQVYTPTTNTKEAEAELFYEDLQDFLELTPKRKKRFPFHHRILEYKSRSQEIPGIAGKFGFGAQNEAQQRLIVLSREDAGQ